MKYDSSTYTLSDKGSAGKIALIVGVVMLLISAAGYFTNSKHFFHSYLLGYMFWLTLAWGGLFFTMVNHLFGSEWNIVLRRISEATMQSFPILAILFIPILFGMHDLFHWTHPEEVAKDPILAWKQGYLNVPFFIVRAVIYFAAWIILSRVLYRLSLKQDKEPDERLIVKMRQISAPGTVIFALTITFASFDWLMSLDPHWFSTIFGVYLFSGSLLAIIVFSVMVSFWLRKKGVLTNAISVEHYHDLAKMIFAFLVFWGYMQFSQYFLIWYANIPEETVWYYHRWTGNWKIITMTLVFGHFALPFIALSFRAAKRNLTWLTVVAAWVFVMHFIDLYWLVFPYFMPHSFHLSWMDITLLLGIGGLFFWNFWNTFTAHPLVPVSDRRLEFSLNFKNI